MNITVRRSLRVFAGLIGLLLILWLLVWSYVLFNKKMIISKVTTLINEKVKGEVNIADLEPSLISTFPYVSIHLSKVSVRDSLWRQHKHDFVNANNIYIRLGILSLFSGSPEVRKVIVQDGRFYLFSDSTGYSNEYIFKRDKKTASQKSSKSSNIPDVEFKNVRVTIEFNDRKKLYDFNIAKLNCATNNKKEEIIFKVKTDMLVHSLAFNTNNGSFVKEKPLKGDFQLDFNRQSKRLSFNDIELDIAGSPFAFTGMFDFSSPPPLYKLSVTANDILYKKASSLISYNISKKLDSFNITEPLDVSVVIDGSTRPNKNPLITLNASVENSGLSTPIGEFTKSSFKAHFTNQLSASERRVDKNSGFHFTNFQGVWEGIKLNADSVAITNLEHPNLKCDVRSEFAMKELNDLLGSNTVAFTGGKAKLNVRYNGSIIPGDTSGSSIYGDLGFQNTTIYYVPRRISLTDCSGKLEFLDQDVYVRSLKAESGNTNLVMNGNIKNVLTLIDESPEKILLNWNIASPSVNLADFTSFLQKRSAAAQTVSAKRKFMKLTNQLDKMLNDCSVDLQLNAGRLKYKKFEASNVAANLLLTNRLISLRNVMIQHAGGSMNLTGSLREEDVNNSFTLNTAMNNVNIQQVFTSFNNFGQDGIMDKNLRGNLTAKINLVASITDKAEILQNTLKGTIQISLKDGRLINFEPVQKISETAFKNRDFSDIKFAELKDKLEVNGSEIKVNRMEISSTVLTMFVEGIYDVKKGTDLSIQIPLSNLKKKDEDEEIVNRGVKSKNGISLWLRAKTGDEGKAKISWDPFKLALKDKPDTDSTDVAKNKVETPVSDTLNVTKKKIEKIAGDSANTRKTDTTGIKKNYP